MVNISLVRLLIGSVLISFSPIFIRLADVDPDLAGCYRMLFAVIGLLPLLLFKRERLLPEKKPLLLLIGCGIWLALDFMCWHRSIVLIGPGLSTLLANFQIFVTVLFSWLMFGERVSAKFMIAVVVAVSGLFMVTGVDFSALASSVKTGLLLGLLTAVAYSGYLLMMKQAMAATQVSGLAAMLVISISCGSFLGLVELASGGSFVVNDGRSLLALAAVGIVCTSLGWSLITSGVKDTPVTVAGLIILLQPALAFVWDVVIFDRPTGGIEYLGICMILAAVYFASPMNEKGKQDVMAREV